MKNARKNQEPAKAEKAETTEKRPRGRRVGSRQNPFAKRVDVHVGERLRERRSFMGYTQESLAQELVLSHQQVQKYETGANRISAGRLYELARTLDVPIQYFFEGFDESLPAHTPKHGGTNRAAIEIAQNFSDIKDQTVRSTLSSLVKTLATHSRGE